MITASVDTPEECSWASLSAQLSAHSIVHSCSPVCILVPLLRDSLAPLGTFSPPQTPSSKEHPVGIVKGATLVLALFQQKDSTSFLFDLWNCFPRSQKRNMEEDNSVVKVIESDSLCGSTRVIMEGAVLQAGSVPSVSEELRLQGSPGPERDHCHRGKGCCSPAKVKTGTSCQSDTSSPRLCKASAALPERFPLGRLLLMEDVLCASFTALSLSLSVFSEARCSTCLLPFYCLPFCLFVHCSLPPSRLQTFCRTKASLLVSFFKKSY